jgi:hypothetical protein
VQPLGSAPSSIWLPSVPAGYYALVIALSYIFKKLSKLITERIESFI